VEWRTAEDDRVCAICGPRNGERYALDDAPMQPPAHPSCRCWIVPVVMTPEELRDR
jgi:SPP1 gp7 family putative phage head morphogenesis protein